MATVAPFRRHAVPMKSPILRRVCLLFLTPVNHDGQAPSIASAASGIHKHKLVHQQGIFVDH